ncbi:transglutaminase domain-containing protein [uncultured Muribaculum sp.]|nr:transglutaminase domain-containing protein [uncultured Muribaculum sp.]
MKSGFMASISLFIFPTVLYAASPERNVVIAEGEEVYKFVSGKRGIEVVHSVSDEYLATRRSERICPHIFHTSNIRLDKASGGKPLYRNVNSPSVFHDDSKVCYFDIFLERKDKKAKVNFKRTFTDPAHFTGIFPLDEYPVLHKTFTVEIPASLAGIELVETNFPDTGITRSDETMAGGARRITYTVTDVDKAPDDRASPSPKELLPYIMVKGYFPDTDSLYRYHERLLAVDTVIPDVGKLVRSIVGGMEDVDAGISALYRYVQDNVRYVAFEEGEAGYRPDAPAEVLRKRYGDCKGMSMLLATLLNRAGVDASVAITGTRSIPFRISENPSLSAADHMICVVPRGAAGYLFLDPTNEQISYRHIPWSIRGKDAMMILPGGGYRMVDIPAQSPCHSEDVITYHYSLASGGPVGRAERRCTEDMAERFITIFNDVPRQHLDELLAKSLIPGAQAMVMEDSVGYDRSVPGIVTLSAPVCNPAAVTFAGDVLYVDLNASGGPFGARIDTEDRRSDYEFSVPATIERRTILDVPDGYDIVLPSDYESQSPQARLSCTFTKDGRTVTMTKRMIVDDTRIPLSDIPAWNRILTEWTDACNRQVELRRH